MLSLGIFLGKFDANRPVSACRSVYTVVLLHEADRNDEAMKELDLEEWQVSATVHCGRMLSSLRLHVATPHG